MVGLIEALSQPTKRTRQLLELALTWEDAKPSASLPQPKYNLARQLRSDEVDELVQSYQAGKTVSQLAARHGIARCTVGRHLERRGIRTRPPALTSPQCAKAAVLYQDGWSLAKIGKLFNVSADTVRKYLIEAGVTMRRPWERSDK